MNDYSLALPADDPSWPKMISQTEIPGLLIYKRGVFEDERGFFHEIVELRDLETVLGKKINVVQANHARSKANVIRGFHAEPWEKIVYVTKGKVLSVVVDFRTDSPTFGKALKFELGDSTNNTIYLPTGMGNSMCTLGEEDAEYIYLITQYFEGKPTPAVNYNDPMLTKQFGGWPVSNPIVSDKDKNYPTLEEKFGNEVDFSKFPWLNQ